MGGGQPARGTPSQGATDGREGGGVEGEGAWDGGGGAVVGGWRLQSRKPSARPRSPTPRKKKVVGTTATRKSALGLMFKKNQAINTDMISHII
jgi:hypothetical protein